MALSGSHPGNSGSNPLGGASNKTPVNTGVFAFPEGKPITKPITETGRRDGQLSPLL